MGKVKPDISSSLKKNVRTVLNRLGINSITKKNMAAILTGITALFFIYYFFYLANFHLSIWKQYVIGWGCIIILMICNRTERCKKPPLRFFFVMVALFINVRYFAWRTTETLIYDGMADFIGMSLLFGAELYAISLHFLGIYSNIWPLANKIIPLPEDSSVYPSVDVLITTYNEPPDMVKITAIAARAMDYPPHLLNVHILDDGGTVAKRNAPETAEEAWARHYELRRIARDTNTNYITRQRNVSAKAGNLNHALTHTTADLVLILDCDHVPTGDFLKNTVGWFLKDEKLAFVQTPHFFINPNPVEKNISALKDLPGEHELFYRANHPGLNFWNASFFCGSAAILRRSYLLEVGGVCGKTITEDCETAMALHRRGYNSVYIPRPMVCGLSPETFDDFILQRRRWAQGMTQMMILDNPLIAKGLSPFQRLCYFNNGLFWLFGISRFIFFVAPAAFLLLGLHVYFASVNQVVAFALPHIVSSVILTDFFYGKYRWPFLSELYEGIQSIFLIPVVFSVFLSPTKPSFKVTPKGKNLDEAFFSGLTLPFFVMCLVLLFTIPAAIYKWYSYPLYRDVITITISWTAFNFTIAMAAFGAFFEKRQIRGQHRIESKGKVLLFFPRLKKKIEATIEDVSLSGLGLTFRLPFELKALEHIEIEARDSHGEKHNLEARIQRIVRQGDEYQCGSQFLIQDEEDYSRAIRFVYGDSQKWVEYWGKNPPRANMFRLILMIVKMAMIGFKVSMITFTKLGFNICIEVLRRLRISRKAAPVSTEAP